MAGIDPISNLATLGTGVVDLIGKFVPDKNAQAQLIAAHEHDKQEYALSQLSAQKEKYVSDIELLKAQAATNTTEASSSNFFVAGWRPFCGWAAGVTVFGGVWFGLVMLFMGKNGVPTEIALLLGIPVTILMGMLGLHSLDRFNGVAAEQDPADPTPKQKALTPPK